MPIKQSASAIRSSKNLLKDSTNREENDGSLNKKPKVFKPLVSELSSVPYDDTDDATVVANVTDEPNDNTEEQEEKKAESDNFMKKIVKRAKGTSEEDTMEALNQLDELFDQQAKAKMVGVPTLDMPPQLKTKLLTHQVDGVRYFVNQERTGGVDPPYYTKKNKEHGPAWVCRLTRKHRSDEPPKIRGGILADDMGLGKTLQVISIILANPANGVVYPCSENGTKRRTKPTDGCPSCTIIVCPVSVIANWSQQIEKHVGPGVLRTAIYSGDKRHELIRLIKVHKLDVVFVSYGTLSSDYRKHKQALEDAESKELKAQAAAAAKVRARKSTDSGDTEEELSVKRVKLSRLQIGRNAKAQKVSYKDDESLSSSSDADDFEFDEDDESEYDSDSDVEYEIEDKETIFDVSVHRIVLDEAHEVRNPSTIAFKAVSAVDASNKICLTGTPFMNKPGDLQAQFAFLGLEPLNDKSVFESHITNCIQQGRCIGLARLRTAMGYAMLRRTKAKAAIKLVKKTHELVKIEMPEGNPHTVIHDVLFSTAQAAFDAALGLRDAGEKVKLTMMFELVLRVRQACCDGVLVPAKRIASAVEVDAELKSRDERNQGLSGQEGMNMLEKLAASYPKKRADGDKDGEDGHEEEEEEEIVEDLDEEREPLGVSPKTTKLLQLIEEMAPDEKGVIFSTFTKHLDLVQTALEAEGHTCTRIQGTMTAQDRLDAIDAFNQEDIETSPRFILCSLLAAGVGINLLRGNVAFMLSPWWNEAAQNQAMDRVHRLGQTRPVRVYSLVIADSIEERLLKVQMHKTTTGKGSMQKLSKKEEQRVKLTAMKDLFQLGEKDQMDLADFIVNDSDEEYL